MEINELQKILHSPYQDSKSFVEHIIFPIFGQDDYEDDFDKEWLEEDPSKKSLALATGIESVKQVGSMYIDVEPLVIFDITVSDRVRMERNRQGIQKLVRQMMGPYSCAVMLFHYQDKPDWDWRFSFMHKRDKDSTSTSAKRYTFLLGPRQSCLTAAINFHKLYELHGSINEKALEEAFSVEALSNEFFKRYKEHYENFVSYITGKAYRKEGNKWVEKVVKTDNDEELYARFGHDDKRIRDYVKRLLGRITFLHFVQKKGWLGVPAGQDWNSGNGDLDFMRQLFLQASDQQKDDFLDAVLEPLFNAIDTDRKEDDYLFDTGVLGKVRIPYLNGGLFERNEDDRIPSRFPQKLFADLLEFFSEYNFTVDENDPDDAQVGIDPEMLSRIFENLLEDNKDKGAYYTPKEVVHYMCRESLIAYLQTDYKDKKQQENIRHFVETQEVDGIESIKDNIDNRLKEVKICDPAIGSGAFPMGMLKEIFLCRSVLEDVSDAAQIKREIIQNNIYGVDIEKGAVEIARLRFWLSLIVDEKSPETLPNLDYKIMQGNSLLTTFRGQYVDLDIHDHIKGSTAALNLNMTRLAQAQKKLFNAEGEEKLLTQINIKLIIVESVIAQLQYEFDSFTRANNTVQGTLNFGTTNEKKTAKVATFPQERMEILQECLRLKEQLLDDTVSCKARAEMVLPFFDWHMMFNDVFSRPSKVGFDIVIGNPPYIQLQNNGGELAQMYKDCRFSTFVRTGDIYCLFYECGWKLLHNNGHLCYITSNKWMRAGYGEKIRNFFAHNTNPMLLVDFAGVKIFDSATVDTNILLFEKSTNKHNTICSVTKDQGKDSINNLSDFVRQQHTICDFCTSDSWVVLSPIEQSIKRKIEAVGTPLKDWDIKINYGIKTGCNEAFIISTDKRNEILSNCKDADERKRTEELIRPILRGRDIKRYGYEWAGVYLIATFPSRNYDIEQYPAVKKYLLSYADSYLRSSKCDDIANEHLAEFCHQKLAQTGKIVVIDGNEVIISGKKEKARKKTSNKWFETQDSISYWEDFNKPKLFYADITQHLNFCLCRDVMYCNNTTYFITTDNERELRHLQKYLNSPLIDWYYKTLSVQLGEKAVRMFSIYVLEIPIPPIGEDNIYEAYHLNATEIAFIEGKEA